MSVFITGHVDLHYLAKVMAARTLHCKFIVVAFKNIKYLWEIF